MSNFRLWLEDHGRIIKVITAILALSVLSIGIILLTNLNEGISSLAVIEFCLLIIICVIGIIIIVIACLMVIFLYSLRKRRVLVIICSLILLVPLTIALTVWYAVRIEPDWVRVKKVTIADPQLSRSLSNLKIILMGDMHILDWVGKREERMINLVNKIQPDIILLHGDYVTRSADIENCVRVLSRLKASIGIWAVPGEEGVPDLSERLRRIGIRVLKDEVVRLAINNQAVYLVGSNEHSSYDWLLNKRKPHIPTIFLLPAPKINAVNLICKYPDINLILAADTHGYQCGIKQIRRLVMDEGVCYVDGLYRVFATYLYVTHGIGWHYKPARFLSWPEIVLFKFTDSSDSSTIQEPEYSAADTNYSQIIRKIWNNLDTSNISRLLRGEKLYDD